MVKNENVVKGYYRLTNDAFRTVRLLAKQRELAIPSEIYRVLHKKFPEDFPEKEMRYIVQCDIERMLKTTCFYQQLTRDEQHAFSEYAESKERVFMNTSAMPPESKRRHAWKGKTDLRLKENANFRIPKITGRLAHKNFVGFFENYLNPTTENDDV